jgi:hypothetical protein
MEANFLGSLEPTSIVLSGDVGEDRGLRRNAARRGPAGRGVGDGHLGDRRQERSFRHKIGQSRSEAWKLISKGTDHEPPLLCWFVTACTASQGQGNNAELSVRLAP